MTAVSSNSDCCLPSRTPAEVCKSLRADLGGLSAQRELAAMTRRVGIVKVRLADLPIDGMLLAVRGGFEAVISTNISRTRQRYTLAHEAGHLALGSTGDRCLSGRPGRNHVERAADAFAAELLMPAGEFEKVVSGRAPSAAALRQIADHFLASPEAAALRICELGVWSVAVVVWRRLVRLGSIEKLRVDWTAAPTGSRLYLPRYATAPPEIERLWGSGRDSPSELVRLRLGSLRGAFALHTLDLGSALLSLVVLAAAPGSATSGVGGSHTRSAPST